MKLTDFDSRVQAMNQMDTYAHLRAVEIQWPSWEEHQRRVEAQREQHRKFAALFRDQSK